MNDPDTIFHLTQQSFKTITMKSTKTLIGIFGYALLLTFVVSLNSCKKDENGADVSFKITSDQVTPHETSAEFEGSFSCNGGVNSMSVVVGKRSEANGNLYAVAIAGNSFSVTVTDLEPNTEYFYQYDVYYGDGEHLQHQIIGWRR